jgi:hypothetical protein
VKHYLHLVDYVLWALVIVTQLGLLFEAIRRRIASDLPRFVIFLGFLSVESMILAFISSFLSYELYVYTYFAGLAIQELLLLLVAYEIFLKVFEPQRALPAHTVARIICSILAVAALAMTTVIPSTYGESGGIWSLIQRFRVAVEFVVCFSFWLLVVYAWFLNLAWWTRVTYIATGFLLYLTLQTFLYGLIWHVPEPYRPLLARLKVVAYLGGLGFWVAAVRTKQISFGPASLEDFRLIKVYLHDLRLAVLKLRTLRREENPNEQ